MVGNGGLLTASGTTFNGSTGYTTQIVVNSGGHLTGQQQHLRRLSERRPEHRQHPQRGRFHRQQLQLARCSCPKATCSTCPAPAATTLSSRHIDILAGSVASGQTLALNAIGTASTANLLYVFAGNFTVSSGATVTVGPNVSVLIQDER